MGAHSSGTRFDYLFERIAAETTDEIPAVEAVVSAPRARRWWPVPVIAVMAGLAGAVVVIQSWPGPGDDVPGPSAPVTHLAPAPIVSTVPVVEAPAEFVAPPEVTARDVREPALVPPPSSAAPPAPRTAFHRTRGSAGANAHLRSPNSVSPEPRPAFPNQHLPGNDDGGPGGGCWADWGCDLVEVRSGEHESAHEPGHPAQVVGLADVQDVVAGKPVQRATIPVLP